MHHWTYNDTPVSERLSSRVVVTLLLPLPTTRRHRVPFSCRSAFLSCFPPCASHGRTESRRGENRPPTATILLFFSRSLERAAGGGGGDRAAGTTAQRREEETSGSTTLLHLSSSPLLPHLLYRFCVFGSSSSPFIRFVVFTRPDKV